MICQNCHDGDFPVGSIYFVNEQFNKQCPRCDAIKARKVPPAGQSYTLDFAQNPDPVNHPNVDSYRELHDTVLSEIRDTDIRKDHDYGRSFSQIYEKFGMTSSVIRLWDKMNRLERLTSVEAKVKDESIRDTLLDLANYAIKTIVELDTRKH